MQNRFIFTGLILFCFLGSALSSLQFKPARAASFRGEKTLVLYDASSGAVPSETLMDFTDFPPGGASLTFEDGAAVMDTTSSGRETFAGWVSGQAISPGFPTLDRTANLLVNFTLQVDQETHHNKKRAGFSVIVLDQEAKGIELAFWEDEIWAQNDDRTGGLFTHGEGVAFGTTAGPVAYQLTIGEDAYTLTANGEQILSGPVRDYSQFDGFPDPYETPNFLFFGDDATSAESRTRLQFVSVTGTEPVLPPATGQSTSTNNLIPTNSLTPQAIATPSSTPAPNSRVVEFCPSGWLILALTIPGAMVITQRRKHTN